MRDGRTGRAGESPSEQPKPNDPTLFEFQGFRRQPAATAPLPPPSLPRAARVRRDDQGEGPPRLRERIAVLCDGFVREVVEYVGGKEGKEGGK